MRTSYYLVIVNIPDNEWAAKIEPRRKVMGRSMTCDICTPVSYDSISRRHADVWCERTGVFLNDLGSLGGTRVNGFALQEGEAVRVAAGDEIALADVEFKLTSRVSKLAELLVEAKVKMNLAAVAVSGNSTLKIKSQYGDTLRLLLSRLTPSELNVVLWMHRGFTTDAELGRILYCSPNTVRTHVANIFEKLEVHSRTEILTLLKRCASSTDSNSDDQSYGHDTTAW